MSQSVQGTTQAGVNFTTTFGSGTAGTATEVNNLCSAADSVGPGQPTGRQVSDCWSQTYTGVAAPFDIDLTNLTGVGGRTVNLPGVKIIEVVNSDPTAGHDIAISSGGTNGFVMPTETIPGGYPGAGVSNGQPSGNKIYRTNFVGSGWTVDPTHKTITITPTGTVTSVTLIIAG